MNNPIFLIVHKDHTLSVTGVNAGAEMATRMLARYLVRAGRRAIVAAQLAEGEQIHEGVEFWDLGADFNVGKILERISALGDYHLISAGRALPVMQARSEARCLSRTLITHDRTGNDTGISPAVLSKAVDHLLCVSHAQCEAFVDAGADRSKTTVIHNGVDLQLFEASDPKNRNWRRLVFVGALVQDKGLHVLLHSYAQLCSKYPDLKLDVYGSSKLWGRERLIDEEAVQKQLPGVTFHGAVSQQVVADAFRSCGICVIPSIWFDPFPLTSLEAQATGCPVVAFDVGGLKEGIRHGETGLVVSEITPEALTRALDSVLANPTKLQQMSERAIPHIREYFTWERLSQDVIALCDNTGATRTSSQRVSSSSIKSSPLGLISTWNQECGLATYANYLVQEFPAGSVRVFAEDIAETPRREDQSWVTRCWKRDGRGLETIERAIIREGIKLIHLNFHDHSFINHAGLIPFIERLRAQGIQVSAHLHTTYCLDQRLANLVRLLDGVVVHTEENRLQVIAHGARADTVFVVPHGVHTTAKPGQSEMLNLRNSLGMNSTEKLISAFGFIQPNKGMEAVIEAVAYVNQRGIPARGYIAGKPNLDHPHGAQYYADLKALAAQAGVQSKIVFADRFLSDEEVRSCLGSSDLVVMNYQSQYHESSGACALAVGAGAIVMASLSPVFNAFGNAIWRMTSGFSAGPSAEILLSNTAVRQELERNRAQYCLENSWSVTAKRMVDLYQKLGFKPVPPSESKLVVEKIQSSVESGPIYEIDLKIADLEEAKKRKHYAQVYEGLEILEQMRGLSEHQRESLHVLRGEVLGLERRAEDAEIIFNEILSKNPRNGRALNGKGAIAASRSQIHEAEGYFHSALEVGERRDVALTGLGVCAQLKGEFEVAWKLFQEALELNPDNEQALFGILQIGMSEARYPVVERALTNFLELRPLSVDYLYSLAGCLYMQGRGVEAQSQLQKVFLVAPHHQQARELEQMMQSATK